MLELVVSRGGKDLLSVPLDRGTLRIGRAGTNDLALPDPVISRHQCQVVVRGRKAFLEDKSGGGTVVDGQRGEEFDLRPGSRIELGGLTLILREGEDRAGSTTLAGGGTEVLPGARGGAETLTLSGEVAGRRVDVKLLGKVVSIGSDPGNDVALPDGFVSAFHARLIPRDGTWYVTDLDSTNGTYVNDVRVGEARLDPGAVLGIGRVRLTIAGPARGSSPIGGFHGMISEDPAMQPVFEMIGRAAPTDETVLITGESGSGKELVARALHRLSRRSTKPLVSLNCAALTKDLLESELFGHEKGAFTGAQSRRQGLFEEADQGSLFLDEIGELALDLQAKLLRTLENGEIRRVGANAPLRVDVRVIAATHRSLPRRVQSGDFREDLYYRICVIEIPLPPLRRRPADIPLLADHFLRAATVRVGPRALSDGAREKLRGYRFPGNVRELKHVVTRAAILCPTEVIEADHLAFSPPTLADRVAESQVYLRGKTLRDVEIETIRQTLRAHDGNQKAAARVLGIARSTLIHKMEKYAISAKES